MEARSGRPACTIVLISVVLYGLISLDCVLAGNAPATCADVTMSSTNRPIVTFSSGMRVVCDTETDGGGWVVFQRRSSAAVDFYRGWDDYRRGFGPLGGNFWLGLDHIHTLTSSGEYELRVDITYKGNKYYAYYKHFKVLGEEKKYKLEVSGFTPADRFDRTLEVKDAGDSLRVHNGMKFTTKDSDNDHYDRGNNDPDANCANIRHGGWWYSSCGMSNLNGNWNYVSKKGSYSQGLYWWSKTYFSRSVSFTEMKMRPVTP